MFFKKKHKKDRFSSKYSSMDIWGMSDEEFDKISKGLYKAIAFRGIGGLLLFIICIILLVVGGSYAG